MKHSVRCRSQEVAAWAFRARADSAAVLRADAEAFADAARDLDAPPGLARQLRACCSHLEPWADLVDV